MSPNGTGVRDHVSRESGAVPPVLFDCRCEMKSAVWKPILAFGTATGLVCLTLQLPSSPVSPASRETSPGAAEPVQSSLPTASFVDPGVVRSHRRPVPAPSANHIQSDRTVSSTLPALSVDATRQPVADAAPAIAVAEHKLDSALGAAVSGSADVRHRVIVQALAARRSDVRSLLTQAGAEVLASAAADGSIVADVSAEGIRWLAGHPSILRLSTDAPVHAAQWKFTDGVTLRTSMGLKKDGHLTRGSGSYTGDEVTVAVIDSGIETSKDLERKRIIAFFDFTRSGGLEAVEPYDDHGHG